MSLRMVTVVSGKGGVGKTNVAANLAVAASRAGARVLLVDGDLGLANVDVLLGLVPGDSLADVLGGRRDLAEVVLRGPRGIDVLPAASGRTELAALPRADVEAFGQRLRERADRYDLVLVDAAAGIGPGVVGWSAAADRALLVTTAEPTSLADAYAVLKVLARDANVRRADVLVNEVRGAGEARATHERLERLARRFLEIELRAFGWLPRDARLADAVVRQAPVVELYPASASARRLRELAARLVGEGGLPAATPAGAGAPPAVAAPAAERPAP